jgi:branched-chain amino acid transport system ATP-binding protein
VSAKVSVLELDGVHTFYGKSHVLHGMTFAVPRGEITVLLGRNGVGKTTTLRSIMGLAPPRSGAVRFGGGDVTGQPPHRLARLGIGYVPEGRQIFPFLSVAENLRMASLSGRGGNWTHERVFEYFPVLRERAQQRGRSLSGGEQQMLAIARALAGQPEFLMLDEPSQGLAPMLVRELGRLIERLKGEGLTILLVEQNVGMALEIADRVLVIAKGAIVFSGTRVDFRRDEADLKDRYLAV